MASNASDVLQPEAGREQGDLSPYWPATAAQRRDTAARIKLAYIGGGSTRAPGTMASFVDQGENFDGSESA